MALLQGHVSLLLRPRYLAQLLEASHPAAFADLGVVTPAVTPARLTPGPDRQASLEELDTPSPRLLQAQARSLASLSVSLSLSFCLGAVQISDDA